jgi:hypothetical protein
MRLAAILLVLLASCGGKVDPLPPYKLDPHLGAPDSDVGWQETTTDDAGAPPVPTH